MSLLDRAMERTTSSLSEGMPTEIQRHTHTFEVPAGTASPGVFVKSTAEGEEEVGFWLTLRSLTQRQEMAIINKGMPKGRNKKMTAGFAKELVQATLFLFHESLPVQLGGSDEGVELHRSKREWLWNVLDQRGRNLVSDEYDTLTQPVQDDEDDEAPGNE